MACIVVKIIIINISVTCARNKIRSLIGCLTARQYKSDHDYDHYEIALQLHTSFAVVTNFGKSKVLRNRLACD